MFIVLSRPRTQTGRYLIGIVFRIEIVSFYTHKATLPYFCQSIYGSFFFACIHGLLYLFTVQKFIRNRNTMMTQTEVEFRTEMQPKIYAQFFFCSRLFSQKINVTVIKAYEKRTPKKLRRLKNFFFFSHFHRLSDDDVNSLLSEHFFFLFLYFQFPRFDERGRERKTERAFKHARSFYTHFLLDRNKKNSHAAEGRKTLDGNFFLKLCVFNAKFILSSHLSSPEA